MNNKARRIILRVVGGVLLVIGSIRFGVAAFSSLETSGSSLATSFSFRLDSISLGILFVGAILFVFSFIWFKNRV